MLLLAEPFGRLKVESYVIQMRYHLKLSHPDDLLKFRYVTRMSEVLECMSPGWHDTFAVTHPDVISPWLSHPDDLLKFRYAIRIT